MARPRSAARIRSLKPELWLQDPDFTLLGAPAMLVFLALVQLADDQGRLETDAAHLRAVAVRSLATEEVDAALAELADREMVTIYAVGRRRYVAVTDYQDDGCAWGQRIDKPLPSLLPAPPSADADTGDSVENMSGQADYSRPVAINPDQSRLVVPRARALDRTGPEGTVPVQTGPSRFSASAANAPLRANGRAREDTDAADADATAVENPEGLAPDGPAEPAVLSSAGVARADRLREGCERVLARPLRSPERQLVQGWAADLRRGEDLVPEDEILAVVRRQMTAPTKSGAPPANLRWCEDDVGALARERAPTGGDRPRVLSEAEAVDARLAERQRQLREGGA